MSDRTLKTMKMPYLLAAVALVGGAFISGAAVAEAKEHGTVTMQGSIIDTACAIEMASLYQHIEMPPLPVGQIIRDGFGPGVPFSIHLSDCTLHHQNPALPDWSTFQVTFDGSVTNNGLFGVQGRAEGVGLRITDERGAVAQPGYPMALRDLQTGDMSLNFTLNLAGNHERLRSGDYRTTIRFKLDYY